MRFKKRMRLLPLIFLFKIVTGRKQTKGEVASSARNRCGYPLRFNRGLDLVRVSEIENQRGTTHNINDAMYFTLC